MLGWARRVEDRPAPQLSGLFSGSCPTQCLCSRPSWVNQVTGHYLSTKRPFLSYSTGTCCSTFWWNLKSFSSLQMFNCLNSGERKAGGERERVLGRDGKDPFAPFPLFSPPLLCACHAGYITSQHFQWCIHWYILQANSHVMYWLFWQLLKQSGWNLLVFPYYALPSKDLLWILSYRLASILYIVFKNFWEKFSEFCYIVHVFEVLFVCLLVFALFIFYKFTEPAR